LAHSVSGHTVRGGWFYKTFFITMLLMWPPILNTGLQLHPKPHVLVPQKLVPFSVSLVTSLIFLFFIFVAILMCTLFCYTYSLVIVHVNCKSHDHDGNIGCIMHVCYRVQQKSKVCVLLHDLCNLDDDSTRRFANVGF